MFKSQKQNNKPSPSSTSGERVDFRFSNFQALQVPKGWDRLSLSVISAGTGKVIAKLGKAVVQTGSCQWPETLLESVWIPQDDSSTGTEEYLYKCVVSMGSARSGILGEATINLASYVSSRTASPISLPLKKCNYGTTLQVKIHCLTPRTKLRDEESDGSNSLVKEQSVDYHDSGRNSNVGVPSIHDLGSTSCPGKFSIKERSFSPSGSFEKGFTRGDKLLLKNHLRSEASNHHIGHTGEISENNSPRDSFLFEDHSVSNQPSLNRPGVMSIMENLQHYGKDLAALTNSGSSKKLLEAAEDTIEELRVEAKMWERNARKLMLDLDILRNEFSNQSKKQADLVMELSAAYAEHDSLKKEIENLKLILEESTVKQATLEDSAFQTKGLTRIHEELENEIKHQHALNNSLALQLKRSQESNIELVSVLQELEETIEQQKVEIENLSSMQLRVAEMNSSHKSDMEDNENLLIQLQDLQKSEEKLQGSVKLLKLALEEKNGELENERRSNSQTLLDVEKEYEYKLSVKEEEIARLEAKLQNASKERNLENTGDNSGSNAELTREIEALKEKLQELEKDCSELTDENLDLLLKLKESKNCNIDDGLASVESVVSQCLTKSTGTESEEKFTANENFIHSSELLKQLEVAFHHLKKQWCSISLDVSERCQFHLNNLENISRMDTCDSKVWNEFIHTYLFEINKLLEARITESEEILKQYEFVIQEKNSALEEALGKLEDYSMKFQENKSSKAELEVQCTNLLKELAQKRSEVDRLEANLLEKEEETNFLMQHQRELDSEVADLQKKRDQLEEDLKIMSRENSSSSRCLDDLQNKLKILGEDMDKQIYNNKILQRKSEEIECENHKLENQLMKLKEENLYLESQMKCIATDRDSCHLKLDNSRSVAKKLKAKIMELEVDMENKVASLKQNLEDVKNQHSEAQRECEHLKEENQELEESIENLLEEVKILQKSNSELRVKNVEMQEYCVKVDDQLKQSEKSLCDSYKKVETLEEKIDSMIKDFSFKEENFSSELDELVQENKMQMEKLAQQEVSSQMFQEKLNEVESLQKQVEHLTMKISAMNEENERSATAAANEISSLQADKARMEGVLEGIQSKVRVTENELNTVRTTSELKVQGLMIELAGSKQSYEKLKADHEKMLKQLSSCRTTEEKLKTSMNDLELKLTISQCEHQQLLEDTVNLKFQLQKMTELQDEILDLRNQLHKCRNEKEQLEASMQTIFGDSEEIKSENFSFLDKISTLKEAVLESENCKREKVSLEEKLLQMENNLTEREVQNEDLGTELTKIKRENKLYEQKIYQLEEEKDKSLKRILALEADIKLTEEDKQNCRKTGENGYGFHDGGPNDTAVYIEKIKLLESKLAETLEANKKFKIQLQRFRSEERKTQGASSKRAIAENELAERERFEQTKSSLEAELKDIRERYFEMSLKYAEVEAQRETLVMKLKAAKNGKRRFS